MTPATSVVVTGALRANFDFPAFGGLLTASVGYSYRDDSVLTNEGGPDPRDTTRPLLPIVQPSYSLWDAWIGWLSPNARWRFSVNGKNLGDEEYLTNGYNIPVLGILQGSFGQPKIDLRPHLARGASPALVVIAGDDRVMPEERSRALAEAMGAAVEELPESGHALVTEHPEWLTDKCLAFLESHA